MGRWLGQAHNGHGSRNVSDSGAEHSSYSLHLSSPPRGTPAFSLHLPRQLELQASSDVSTFHSLTKGCSMRRRLLPRSHVAGKGGGREWAGRGSAWTAATRTPARVPSEHRLPRCVKGDLACAGGKKEGARAERRGRIGGGGRGLVPTEGVWGWTSAWGGDTRSRSCPPSQPLCHLRQCQAPTLFPIWAKKRWTGGK